MLATLFADAQCVKALLERGADPNVTDAFGATALVWAMPDLDKARVLIWHGADVNTTPGGLRRTPLLVAASYPRSANVMKLLLSKGADIHATDSSGNHALGRAVLSSDVQTSRLLIAKGSRLNDPGYGRFGHGPMFTRHNLDTAGYVLSAGLKPDKEALLVAPVWHRPEMLAKLVAAGADVNAFVAPLQSTPLLMAAAGEHTKMETLKWLLDHGADPNAEGLGGDRPLDWASYHGDEERIRLLQRFGAKRGAGARSGDYPPPEGGADALSAVTRTLGLLLPTGPVVFKTRGCITCHNQTLPVQVAATARGEGVPVDDRVLNLNLQQIVSFYKSFARDAMQGEQPPDSVLTIGYVAMALAANGVPLNTMTASLTHLVASSQMPDGSWLGPGVSRAPMEESDVSATAMAVRALTLYPIPGRSREIGVVLARAERWLRNVRPRSAEERNMQLLGLVWAKAQRKHIEGPLNGILQRQAMDGGWAQRDNLPADAYATGQSLIALREAGVPVTGDAYQKGIAHLLRNQYRDGSWLVRSRSFPFSRTSRAGSLSDRTNGYRQPVRAGQLSRSQVPCQTRDRRNHDFAQILRWYTIP